MSDILQVSEISGSNVSIPPVEYGARSIDAYLVFPKGTGPFPGVVVIHEIFGLNDNIRDIAKRFAGQGYAALAVDLFSNASKVICMMRIMHGMLIRPIHNKIVVELQSAMDYLSRQPQVEPSRLGAVGFCMGGSYALQLACSGKEMRAASVFYGLNPRPLQAVAQACPIVGSYPEKDFTAQAARALEPVLEQYNIPHDIKIYPGAMHSFFNDTGRNFDPEASADAWQRMLTFFSRYL